MSGAGVRLEDLKRQAPGDLAHCTGYVWHLKSRIGKGSFGEVFRGWSQDGKLDVAVKVVQKHFFKQDPKVKENLEREIRILKVLKNCEYVVHLYHVEELKTAIVLVMELCECDLDQLVKTQPFKEEDITRFITQLAQGMKALRSYNIVHRDLKPGNILIKFDPQTRKMIIKLADFGFARYFTDEGMKPIDMTSLAGTPVFMAPEALRCVFHPGEHYDDKVDIWSIGALLYKVIVGQCGFYAQLQEIPAILKGKGDAIAFEKLKGNKVNYVMELPPDVDGRLSPPYKERMNKLLRNLLKLDAQERMTFQIMLDSNMTSAQLAAEISNQLVTSTEQLLVFSTTARFVLSPFIPITQEQFAAMLDLSGGKEGHPKLYVLNCKELQEQVELDDGLFTQLSFLVAGGPLECAVNITERKYSENVFKEISTLQTHQKCQVACVEYFNAFVTQQLGSYVTHFRDRRDKALRLSAQATLAFKWLTADTTALGVPPEAYKSVLQELDTRQKEIQSFLTETNGVLSASSVLLTSEGLSTLISKYDFTPLLNQAKQLATIRKDEMYKTCQNMLGSAKILVENTTKAVKDALVKAFVPLNSMWSLLARIGQLDLKCSQMEVLLDAGVQECRRQAFRSLSVQSPKPTAPASKPGDTVAIVTLTTDNEKLRQDVASLSVELERMKQQVTSSSQELVTLRAKLDGHNISEREGGTLVASKPPISPDDEKILKALAEQLDRLCALAEKLKPGITSNLKAPPPPGASALYPMLAIDGDGEEFSILEPPVEAKVSTIIPQASQLVTAVASALTEVGKAKATPDGTLNARENYIKQWRRALGSLLEVSDPLLWRSWQTSATRFLEAWARVQSTVPNAQQLLIVVACGVKVLHVPGGGVGQNADVTVRRDKGVAGDH
eukprot:Em0015g1136a